MKPSTTSQPKQYIPIKTSCRDNILLIRLI